MNFLEMYKTLQEGKKARRHGWKEGECVFWVHDFIAHNTPYHTIDIPVCLGTNPAYKYVVERDDPIAQDWEIMS